MNLEGNARVLRIRLIAAAVALFGLGLVVTACSDGDSTGAMGYRSDNSNSSADGTYVDSTEGQYGDVAVVHGDKIIYLSLHASPKRMCALLDKTFKDVDGGRIVSGGNSDRDRYEVESTGTITASKTAVVWDDGNGTRTGTGAGTGAIKIVPGMITLAHIFDAHAADDVFVVRDSEPGNAVIAKFCR